MRSAGLASLINRENRTGNAKSKKSYILLTCCLGSLVEFKIILKGSSCENIRWQFCLISRMISLSMIFENEYTDSIPSVPHTPSSLTARPYPSHYVTTRNLLLLMSAWLWIRESWDGLPDFWKKNQTNLVFDTLKIIMKLFNLKNSCSFYPDIDVQTPLRHPHKSFKEVHIYEQLCFFWGQTYFIIVTVWVSGHS